jgi:hypothetical protein
VEIRCWHILDVLGDVGMQIHVDALRMLALGVCFSVVRADGCTLGFSICFGARSYVL